MNNKESLCDVAAELQCRLNQCAQLRDEAKLNDCGEATGVCDELEVIERDAEIQFDRLRMRAWRLKKRIEKITDNAHADAPPIAASVQRDVGGEVQS